MNIRKHKGMTLIEVVLAIALLSIIAISLISGFSSQMINITKGSKITDEALEAQAIMEDTIFDAKKKIQKSESLDTIDGWSKKSVEVFGTNINMQKINVDYPNNANKDATIYLSTKLAEIEKREPLKIENVSIDVSTDTTNKIADLAGNPILNAQFKDNSLEAGFYANLFQWWQSKPGKELSDLNFPDDYTLIPVSKDTNVLNNLGSLVGASRYVTLTITPVDINGHRGNTERSTNTVLVKGKEWRVGDFPWIDKNKDYDFGSEDVKLDVSTIKMLLNTSLPYQNPSEPSITEDISNGSLFVPMKTPPSTTLTPGDEYIEIASSEVIDWIVEKDINLAKSFMVKNNTDIKMTSGSKGGDGSIFLYQYIELDSLGNEITINGNSKTIESGVSLETDADIILKTGGRGNIELLGKNEIIADNIIFEPKGSIYVKNSKIDANKDIIFDVTKSLNILGSRHIKIDSSKFSTSTTGRKVFLKSRDSIEFLGGGWSNGQTIVVADEQTIKFAANSEKVHNLGSIDLGNTGKIKFVNSMNSDMISSLKLRLEKESNDKFEISTVNYIRNIGYADKNGSTGVVFNAPGLWKNIGVNNTNLEFTTRIISGNGNIEDIEYHFDGNKILSLKCNRKTQVNQTKIKIDIRDKYSDNSIVGSGYFNYTVDSAGNATIETEEPLPVDYYTITYDTAGGSDVPAFTALEGDTVSSPTNPTKSGYKFIGWDTTIPPVMPGYDMIITAKWEAQEYTVTFNALGGTPPSKTKKVIYKENYGDLPEVTRNGFDFIGWFTEPTGGVQVLATDKYSHTSDQTLYAHWVNNKYTVTFNSNGGSTPSFTSKEVSYNVKYGELPNNMTRTGYTFDGWSTSETGAYRITSEDPVTTSGDHTLYARWKGNIYTVTFDSNGGSIPSPPSKEVTYGELYGTLPSVSKWPDTFQGWYTNDSKRITQSDRVEIASDHTLTAGWGSCPFVYSYDGNQYHFEHEPVPNSINKAFETTTYGNLYKLQEIDGRYNIRITEELNSETYVNGLKLYAVDFKEENDAEEMIADIFGKPHTVKNRIAPKAFVDSMDRNWLEEITKKGKLVTSPTNLYDKGQYVMSYEAIFNKPEDLEGNAKLIISTKATELVSSWGKWFNEIIDGKNNIWWIQEALLSSNTDELLDIIDIINLEVDLWDGNNWVNQGNISAGAYLFEEYLIPIDLNLLQGNMDELKIRLRSGVGFFEIDQVSVDYSNDEIIEITDLEIDEARLNGLNDVSQILSNFKDDKRVKLKKGDYIDISFEAPRLIEGYKRGFIVEFKGHFTIGSESRVNPIVDSWEGVSFEEIIQSALEEQPESAKTIQILEWLYELKDSVYRAPLEYKIEKFIVDNVLPWLEENSKYEILPNN